MMSDQRDSESWTSSRSTSSRQGKGWESFIKGKSVRSTEQTSYGLAPWRPRALELA